MYQAFHQQLPPLNVEIRVQTQNGMTYQGITAVVNRTLAVRTPCGKVHTVYAMQNWMLIN